MTKPTILASLQRPHGGVRAGVDGRRFFAASKVSYLINLSSRARGADKDLRRSPQLMAGDNQMTCLSAVLGRFAVGYLL